MHERIVSLSDFNPEKKTERDVSDRILMDSTWIVLKNVPYSL
jgi:hypothetical protein